MSGVPHSGSKAQRPSARSTGRGHEQPTISNGIFIAQLTVFEKKLEQTRYESSAVLHVGLLSESCFTWNLIPSSGPGNLQDRQGARDHPGATRPPCARVTITALS